MVRTSIVAVTLGFGIAAAASAQEGELVIYNPAGDAGELLIDAFSERHPNISVAAINAGVGEIFTRIAAESDNPRGDVVICASSEAFLANPDHFAPFESAERDNFPDDVIGPDGAWYGCSMPLQAFVVNTRLVSEEDMPESWADLADPKYEGQIVLANPSLSGSAYAQLAQILQLHGWEVAEGIMANARFVTSSQSVFQDVGRGEMEIGVTGESNIKRLIDDGFPVVAVYPSDGTGMRYDASAIIEGGPNPENAELFLEFLNSAEAHELITTTGRRSVRPDIAAPEGLAETADIVTFDYDADEAAATRDENIARWEELFAQ